VVPDIELRPEGEGRYPSASSLIAVSSRNVYAVFVIEAYLPSPYKTSTSSALPFEVEDACCWCLIRVSILMGAKRIHEKSSATRSKNKVEARVRRKDAT